MKLLALSFAEIGLNPVVILLIIICGLFFLYSFALTSGNMDTEGLLRVLNAKPLRKSDGTVEYRKKE